MIYVIENKTTKVPGLTSFYIKFDYKKELVDTIKQCELAVYNKTNQIWEIPATSLYKCVNLLYQYDSVKIKFLPDTAAEVPEGGDVIINYNYKTTPFEYQKEGITYGLNHNKWLLLDAPGLGKSLQAIYIAEGLYNLGKIKNCLIISGKNMLKYNWKNEIIKHSKLDACILGEKISKTGKVSIGTVKERIKSIKDKPKEFFTITNIETLRDPEIIKPINDNYDMIIIDEVHVCKSATSQQGKNLLKLKSNYKLAMTGTLLLNSPFDCYVPLKFIEAENCTLTNFKNYYGKFYGFELVGYRNTEVLKKQLELYSLRRTKDLLDLPDKTIINEVIEMNPEQETFYKNIELGIVDQVDKTNINTTSLLSMITRLRQATAAPQSLTSEDIISAKVERCKELVDEIIDNGDSVVVFSTFKETANQIYNLLYNYNPLLVTGDASDPEADIKFQNNEDIKVFVGTWQKAGTGLTLTKANYMIFIDTPWTYAVYEQAQDRIYRIGTNKKVFIYNLICKDTIDERVQTIVNTKRAISDYVVDDKLPSSDLEELKKYIIDLSNRGLDISK